VAGENRVSDRPLAELLAPRARHFSFFQLVRLLELFSKGLVRTGYGGPASAEALRFRPDTALAFPATDVTELELLQPSETTIERSRITTTFLGLYGSSSPLPSFYSEEILWADEDPNRVRDFLDLFHHRLLSLFYRCWSKYRHYVQFEYGKDDPLTPRLLSLIGLGSQLLNQGTGLPEPLRLLHFAGLINQQPHSASALECILSEYFDHLPVEIEQCTGRWVTIQNEQLSRLGEKNCRLGTDCSIGSLVYSRTGNFRIWIGPINYQKYIEFLPDQQNHSLLHSLVNFFTIDQLEFDTAFRVLQPPRLQLLSKARESSSARLGWNSWLFSDTPGTDHEETVVFNRASPKGAREEVRRSA
jgi:type VI secretion system protein ImpH